MAARQESNKMRGCLEAHHALRLSSLLLLHHIQLVPHFLQLVLKLLKNLSMLQFLREQLHLKVSQLLPHAHGLLAGGILPCRQAHLLSLTLRLLCHRLVLP